MRRALTFMCAFGMLASVASAQSADAPPLKIGDAVVTSSLRTRMYSWNWFGDTPNGEYTYSGSLLRFGLTESRKTLDWQVEFAVPALVDMPTTAVMPAPFGQLGLGGSYAAANSGATNSSSIFLKQGNFRIRGIGGVGGQSIKAGRMEFIDGSEVTPAHGTLAALKRDRIAQRLLANFGFTDVQRSLDGGQYVLNMPRLNITAVAARPTEGVFQVSGWDELKINVFYGAVTGQHGKYAATDWRVFALGYSDYRTGVVKTDNRVAAIRNADADHINIGTYGGHILQIVPTTTGPVDLLFWGALQSGSWGTQTHSAGAFAAEAGWQPALLKELRPWIRGGYDVGSGDDNPADGRHTTFFQVLPTPRIYARTPFYNMMNSKDAFAELILRPKRVTIRSDIHSLRLADSNDLWYSGGGAFQATTFGYTGRPSNGQSTLGTLYDVSADLALTPHVGVGGYIGYAAGGLVTQAIYTSGNAVHLAFFELNLKF
jgi:alginate export protein